MFLECGRNAIEPAKRRLAGDAGVDHPIVEFFALDTLFQQRNPAFVLRQAEGGGNAVAQNQNGLGGARHRRRNDDQQQKEKKRTHG